MVVAFALQILLLLCVCFAQGATIYGWGRNNVGQIGLGNTQDPIYNITAIPYYASVTSVTDIALGQQTHFATTSSGVVGCGDNSNGQLGLGAISLGSSTPQLVSGLQTTFEMFPLPLSTLAYDPTLKTIDGWGYAAGFVQGVLSGVYSRVQQLLPSMGISGQVKTIATGNGCCFAILTNGSVYASGFGANGRLGLGSTANVNNYQKVPFWDTIPIGKIYPSHSPFVCALSANGSLYCWGANNVGQLGCGTTTDASTPQRVAYFDANELIISQFAQGDTHSIALTCGGKVFTWGSNIYGQLGIGRNDTNVHPTPIEVTFLADKKIVEIVAGASHNFARTASNDWFVWGLGNSGALGLGNVADVLTPTLNTLFKSLSINHIESGSYALFALGYYVSSATTTPPNCPPVVQRCANITCPDVHMTCTDTERSYICECNSGYQLEPNNTCANINECLNASTCVSGATCNDTDGSFNCTCPPNTGGDGLPDGTGCSSFVCGNGIVEPGEECDVVDTTISCCNESCFFEPSGTICRPAAVPCEHIEICNGTSAYCPVDDWDSNNNTCDYCGDGRCNTTTENCKNCLADCASQCDPNTCAGYVCNGKCVASLQECVCNTLFTCDNGTCVNDFALCQTQTCENYECWDGSCQDGAQSCATIPACPSLSLRCDGQCISLDETCGIPAEQNCSSPYQLCVDGTCDLNCEQYNGCPTGQILCPSGLCGIDLDVCKGNCEGDAYLCADGSCNLPGYCSSVPRLATVLPFTQQILPDQTTNLALVSATGVPLGSVQVPPGTFGANISISVTPVSLSLLSTLPIPAGWNGTSMESNLFSAVISFGISDGTSEFTNNISLTFSATVPQDVNISTLCLGFVNSSNEWDCASDIIELGNATFEGVTSHFTPFGVIKSIKPPKFNALDASDINVFKNINGQSVIIYVYCGLVIVFTCLYVWAFHADKEVKDWEKNPEPTSVRHTMNFQYEEEMQTPKKPRGTRGMTARSGTPDTVNNNSAPPTGSDRSSRPPSALESNNSHTPPSTVSRASEDGTINIENGDHDGSEGQQESNNNGSAEGNKRQQRKTLLIAEGASQRFTTKHKWLSIYFSARIENLPRVARVTILLSMILTNMTVASVFYNQQNQSTTAQKIIVGVVSSAISFVLSFGILTLFKLVPKRFRWLSYSISAIYIAGTGFLTLWYNLKLEQSAAYGWCVSASIGIVQDAMVNEPLKIVVISVLVAFFPFAPLLKNM